MLRQYSFGRSAVALFFLAVRYGLVTPSAAFAIPIGTRSSTKATTLRATADSIGPPDPDEWIRWSSDSLKRFTGLSLLERTGLSSLDQIHNTTAFAVLSHGTQDDPIYHYFNQGALELFERNATEIFTLPSRLSAPEGLVRSERKEIVEQVVGTECRCLPELLRITKTGKLFRAYDVWLWNVYDDEGIRRGQTALCDRSTVVPETAQT